jgi:hypothetical protein
MKLVFLGGWDFWLDKKMLLIFGVIFFSLFFSIYFFTEQGLVQSILIASIVLLIFVGMIFLLFFVTNLLLVSDLSKKWYDYNLYLWFGCFFLFMSVAFMGIVTRYNSSEVSVQLLFIIMGVLLLGVSLTLFWVYRQNRNTYYLMANMIPPRHKLFMMLINGLFKITKRTENTKNKLELLLENDKPPKVIVKLLLQSVQRDTYYVEFVFLHGDKQKFFKLKDLLGLLLKSNNKDFHDLAAKIREDTIKSRDNTN